MRVLCSGGFLSSGGQLLIYLGPSEGRVAGQPLTDSWQEREGSPGARGSLPIEGGLPELGGHNFSFNRRAITIIGGSFCESNFVDYTIILVNVNVE